MTEVTMPKFQVHRKSGGGGEVGCLWDGNSGTFQVSSGECVDFGNGEGGVVPLKIHDIVLDSDGESLPQR